jgi:hypothetical protein
VALHFIDKIGKESQLDATEFIGKLCAADGVLSQILSDT